MNQRTLALLFAAAAIGYSGCAYTAADALDDLKSKDADDRLEAVIALGEMREFRAVAPLVELFAKDPSPLVRANCARSLLVFGPKAPADAFVRALEDKDPLVLRDAVSALGRLETRSALPRIRELIAKAEDPALRRECAKALGRIRDVDSIPVLIDALADSDPSVRLHTEIALGRLTCRDLGPYQEDWRSWYAAFLERMGQPK